MPDAVAAAIWQICAAESASVAPSETSTRKLSCSLFSFRHVLNSGEEISPVGLKCRSPRALDTARPSCIRQTVPACSVTASFHMLH